MLISVVGRDRRSRRELSEEKYEGHPVTICDLKLITLAEMSPKKIIIPDQGD
jgi:hypothetical protein